MKKQYVVLTIWAVFGTIIVGDVYLYFDGIPGNTISQIVRSSVSPYVPFGVGYLFGWLTSHFFD